MDTNTNPTQNNMSPMPPASPMSSMGQTSGQKKSATTLLMVAGAVVLALIIWWVNRAPGTQEAINPTASPTLVTDELQQAVDQLDLGDINSEFDQIDQDLKTL